MKKAMIGYLRQDLRSIVKNGDQAIILNYFLAIRNNLENLDEVIRLELEAYKKIKDIKEFPGLFEDGFFELSMQEISKRTVLYTSPATIMRNCRELEARGLVEIKDGHNGNRTKRYRPNIYTVYKACLEQGYTLNYFIGNDAIFDDIWRAVKDAQFESKIEKAEKKQPVKEPKISDDPFFKMKNDRLKKAEPFFKMKNPLLYNNINNSSKLFIEIFSESEMDRKEFVAAVEIWCKYYLAVVYPLRPNQSFVETVNESRLHILKNYQPEQMVKLTMAIALLAKKAAENPDYYPKNPISFIRKPKNSPGYWEMFLQGEGKKTVKKSNVGGFLK